MLRRLLRDRRWTQAHLARLLGVTPQAVRAWLTTGSSATVMSEPTRRLVVLLRDGGAEVEAYLWSASDLDKL